VIDVGRTFTLTAIGQSSGFTAQTTFTDAINTNIVISSSKNPSNLGDSVTFTATVTQQNTGAPVTQGVVKFYTGGNNCAGNPGTQFGPLVGVAVNASGQASATNTFTTAGNITVRACYNDAANNFVNTNVTLTQRVNSTVATTTSVSSSANPSTYGQAITFTATVSQSIGTTTPTGSVQFKIDGTNFGSPVGLSSGVATSGSTSSLTVAGSPHTIDAIYTPTGDFAGSNGTLTGGQTINKATQTITFGTLADKTFGDPPFTVSATGGASGNPVTFSPNPTIIFSDSGSNFEFLIDPLNEFLYRLSH
jgi:large repetitive protein